MRSDFSNNASAIISLSRCRTAHADRSQLAMAALSRSSSMNWPTSCEGLVMPNRVRRSRVTGPTPGTWVSEVTALSGVERNVERFLVVVSILRRRGDRFYNESLGCA